MNDGVEQETYCVDKNVPLLALDLSATSSLSLLARIVPVRINARPPYMGRLKSSANSRQRRFDFALTARAGAVRLVPFFGSTRTREHSSAPTASLSAAARRACQGWPRLPRPPEGLGLDWPEHGGILDRIGAEASLHGRQIQTGGFRSKPTPRSTPTSQAAAADHLT
jgi:hypothetical protein